MALLDFLNNKMFSPRFMLPIHLVQFVLIAVAMGLSVPRLFMKNQPRTRANTIALAMVGFTHRIDNDNSHIPIGCQVSDSTYVSAAVGILSSFQALAQL